LSPMAHVATSDRKAETGLERRSKIARDFEIIGLVFEGAEQADAAANFHFAVGDYNHDGHPDLYCFKRNHTVTARLEVHILNGRALGPCKGL